MYTITISAQVVMVTLFVIGAIIGLLLAKLFSAPENTESPRLHNQGAMPKPRVYKKACIHCGDVFEFGQHETTQRSDGSERLLEIDCPCCKKTLIFKKESPPKPAYNPHK